MKTEKHNLFCELTDHELVQKGEEIVALYKSNSELDMNKKRLSAAMKRNDEDIEKLLQVVDAKQEEREVECMWVWFWSLGTKKLVRLDTFAVVQAEVIKEWEKQGKLDDYPEGSPSEIELLARQAAEKADDLISTSSDGEKQEGEPDQSPSVCNNDDCIHYDVCEPNHCNHLEMVWECETCVKGNSEPDVPNLPLLELCAKCHAASLCKDCCKICQDRCNAVQHCRWPEQHDDDQKTATEQTAEDARRDTICNEWRECEYKDICFTPENEINGHCFQATPQLIPRAAQEVDQKVVSKLVNTSADDCKISLIYVTDVAVLHAALEECNNSNQKTKAKHISARINQLARAAAA